jgi:hypothetical protein
MRTRKNLQGLPRAHQLELVEDIRLRPATQSEPSGALLHLVKPVPREEAERIPVLYDMLVERSRKRHGSPHVTTIA